MKILDYTLFMLTFALLVVSLAAYADDEAPDTARLLQHHMEEIRENRQLTSDINKDICNVPVEVILAETKRYESDVNPRVRHAAYAIDLSIAFRSGSSLKDRQEVVERLAVACGDLENLVWGFASERLQCFPPEDFSETARGRIRDLIITGAPHNAVIALVGVAGMADQIPQLRKLAENKDESAERPWKSASYAARLALARLGSTQDIPYCIAVIESEPSYVRRATHLQHHLAYMRQPESVLAMRKYLDSDEGLPEVKVGTPGTAGYQYTIGILASILKGFPISAPSHWGFTPGGYNDEEVLKCRDWMRLTSTFEFAPGTTRYYHSLW